MKTPCFQWQEYMHLTAEHWEMVFLKVSRFLKEHGTGIPIVEGDFNETLLPIDRKSKCKHGTFIQPVASLN